MNERDQEISDTKPSILLNHANSPNQRDESSTDTLNAVQALGRTARIYTADLSSADDVAKLVPRILADGHQIRILVNCAGIQRRHPCEKFPDSDFNQVRLTPPLAFHNNEFPK